MVMNEIGQSFIACARPYFTDDYLPKIVAFEPPDQIASAVATSGGAVAVMTEARALASEGVGIVYKRLAPTPMIEYGIAFRKDNPSQPLADFLDSVGSLAPQISNHLPAGYETVSRSRLGGAAGRAV